MYCQASQCRLQNSTCAIYKKADDDLLAPSMSNRKEITRNMMRKDRPVIQRNWLFIFNDEVRGRRGTRPLPVIPATGAGHTAKRTGSQKIAAGSFDVILGIRVRDQNVSMQCWCFSCDARIPGSELTSHFRGQYHGTGSSPGPDYSGNNSDGVRFGGGRRPVEFSSVVTIGLISKAPLLSSSVLYFEAPGPLFFIMRKDHAAVRYWRFGPASIGALAVQRSAGRAPSVEYLQHPSTTDLLRI